MIKLFEEILKRIYGEANIVIENSLSIKVETTNFVAYITKTNRYDIFRAYLVKVKDPHTVSEQDFEILKKIAYFLEFANLEGGDK